MAQRRLLLLSNSTNPGEPWLGWPEAHIRDFLGAGVKSLFFVPFAGVRLEWDEYANMARKRFAEMGYSLVAAHETASPLEAALKADALVVGGGNTFHLLHHLQASGLLPLIRERVLSGIPYIGWSAGTNVACPTIMTTNDMPVVQPASLNALGLVPLQINPHYTEERLPNHGGETRLTGCWSSSPSTARRPSSPCPRGLRSAWKESRSPSSDRKLQNSSITGWNRWRYAPESRSPN